jgi:hypothetical protein
MRLAPIRSLCALALGFMLLFAAGCHRVTLIDDVDLSLNFAPLTGPSDLLHTPYVAGATMNVWAQSTKKDENTTGWTLESSNTAVFQVLRAELHTDNAIAFSCNAAGPGHAILTLKDKDGDVLGTADVDVKRPDTAVLLSHGPLIIGRDDEAPTDEARVLVGGTASFLVRWMAGGELLHGNGVLSTDTPQGLRAETPRTFLFEDRDWLQVSPASDIKDATPIELQLFADGVAVRTFKVIPVQPSEVVEVRLRGEDESHAAKDQWMVVLADALDASGRTLLGIDYQWTLGGKTQSGLGDLFRYQFTPDKPAMLSAEFQSMNAQAMIHAASGFVSSTNFVGCSLSSRRGPAGFAAILAILPAMIAVIRRRARR